MVLDFIKEMILRIGMKSPNFFQKVRWAAGTITTITGLLALLSTAGVHLNPYLTFIGSYNAMISSFLVAIVASLPVEDAKALQDKLNK